MRIVALAGGVGGAKLVDGLSQVLPSKDLTIVVNVGDDFEHFGLYICPDLDTICYTLGGMANPITGWGRAGETWQTMNNLINLGGPGWFKIGDQDLATHLERTRRLKEKQPLSKIVQEFCRIWKIDQLVLPMSDQKIRTIVESDDGIFDFQEYFVQRECNPRIRKIKYIGIKGATPSPGVMEAIENCDALVICPSNPWVSIGPILAVPGMKSIIKTKTVIAISPIIRGQALKGPAAKMYRELGIEPSALSVARQYKSFIKSFVLDRTDRELAAGILKLNIKPFITNIIMKSPKDRKQLAKDVLSFIENKKP
jgi:LPPG:FO 2-phospho-L-lactate transferase